MLTASTRIVIVGAGQAGAEIAFTVRQLGFEGSIVLIGDERHEPYQRPPLSKTLLTSGTDHTSVKIRSSETYVKAKIDLVLGDAAVMVDRRTKVVHLASGRMVPYDKLALALGGRPRSISFGPEQDSKPAVLYSLDDAAGLQRTLQGITSLGVVGGGFIGLEVAAAAASAGVKVTIIEAAARVLNRVCPPVISDYFAELHQANGVKIKTGVSIEQARRDDDGRWDVRLSDQAPFECDHLVAGVGQVPNDELARSAGLAVEQGVLVDDAASTSDPSVVAAGDCTRQHHSFLERLVRLESQQNATDQARVAARTLCGLPPAEATVPWFWSEQYDTKLQMAGLPEPDDHRLVRGDVKAGSFCVVYERGGHLTGVQAVNRPRDFAAGRRLIAGRTIVQLDRLGPDAALAELIPTTTKRGQHA